MRDPFASAWQQQAPDGDPSQLIDFGLLNQFFEDFLEVVGLPAAIIDLEGRVLASSRWQRVCSEFHRVHPASRARCEESDTRLWREMAEGKSYAVYRCRNGLTDCAIPIVVEDMHVANLFVGQFLLAAPDPEEMRRQQEELGFDAEAYAQALAEVPIVDEQRLPAIMRLMGGLAQQIARHSLAEKRTRAAQAQVKQLVAERTRELAASHERLRKIAEHVPGVVFQFMQRADGSFCIPYVSDAFAAMFGGTPEEAREDASRVFEVTYPEDLPGFLESIRVSAESLRVWRHEFRILRDGGVRWVWGEAQPKREEDGATTWYGFITDVTERKQTEMLLKARLRLGEMSASHSLRELLTATLDEVSDLVGAQTAFFHFLLPDQETLSLQAWSTRTLQDYCRASAEQSHYDIERAGIWADAVRLRRSVVYNDYAQATGRKGLPEGHATVQRLMSVPIFRGGRIVAILGLGNKPMPFDDRDLEVVETLADLAWDLAERMQAEAALAERNDLVQRRYESLRALSVIAALPPGGSFDPLTQALAAGARHLGLAYGIIAEVEGDRYLVRHFHGPTAAGIEPGQVLSLGHTYCAMTLQSRDVVAIPHVSQSDSAGHPCYRETGLEAYIGAPIRVDGRLFGTVNFSAPEPYSRMFDQGDLEFMRLLARWIGSVLERNKAAAELLAAKETAESQARELANSNSDLEQFAYVASHDLRQPLRMVNSYLTLIERRYGELLDADGKEFLGYARDGALQMDRLILDLLQYSRVGRHGEPPGVVDLSQVATLARHQLGMLVEETCAELEVDSTPALVQGNVGELTRLLQNLMGNAVKYRSPDRPPVVSVRWRREADQWLLTVADNGIGIAPDYHQDIFKIFRRLHTAAEYEGTGIGLAICQKIVKHHGGRLWMDSEPGQGSRFHVSLPAAD